MPTGIYNHWKIRGRPKTKEHNEKNRQAHLGVRNRKISKAQQGEKNHRWRGNNVGYKCLHKWISRQLGKSKRCQRCKKLKRGNHKVHWANKSGQYLRNLNDWTRLCVKCHRWYDKKRRQNTN